MARTTEVADGRRQQIAPSAETLEAKPLRHPDGGMGVEFVPRRAVIRSYAPLQEIRRGTWMRWGLKAHETFGTQYVLQHVLNCSRINRSVSGAGARQTNGHASFPRFSQFSSATDAHVGVGHVVARHVGSRVGVPRTAKKPERVVHVIPRVLPTQT